MSPPPPPPELMGKLCAWIVEGNTIECNPHAVSCDDLTDPDQPLRASTLRIFIHLQHSPSNASAEEAELSPPVWLGYSDTHLFTSSLFPARERQDSIIGKPGYQAVWQSDKRCDITYSREIIKTTGVVYGHVQSVGSDGKTAYLKLTEEFVNSEGFARGRWTDEF